jgi:hypothetical protein
MRGSAIVLMRATIGRATGLTVHEPYEGGIRVVRLRGIPPQPRAQQVVDARPMTAKVPSAGAW